MKDFIGSLKRNNSNTYFVSERWPTRALATTEITSCIGTGTLKRKPADLRPLNSLACSNLDALEICFLKGVSHDHTGRVL